MNINLRSMFSSLTTLSGVVLGLLSSPFLYSVWVQPPVVVSNPANNVDLGSDAPVMVVNSQGNAISIWPYFTLGFDSSLDNIASSFFTPATGWSPEVTISSLAVIDCGGVGPLYIDQFNPDIAMNSSNYAVAVWEANLIDCINFPFVMLAARSSNGVWNPIETIAEDPTGNLFPKQGNVSVNDAGTALAAWRTLNQNTSTYATTVSFLPFLQPSTPPFSFPLESVLNNLAKPYPVINPSGNAVVVWQFRSPSTGPDFFGIYAATFNASTSTWTGPVALETTPGSNPMHLSGNPRCGMDANGNAVAIWQFNGEVRVAYFNGTAWEPSITLAPSSEDPDTVDVVIDPQGNATAVWQGDLPDFFVFSSSRLPNGTWTTPQAIGQSTNRDGFNVDLSHEPLAVNPVGDVIAGWLTNDTLNNFQAAIKPFGQDWLPAETVFTGDFEFLNQNVGISSCGLAIALWGSSLTEGENSQNRVKASVNNSFVKPPFDAMGKRCCETFATQKFCENILEWDYICPAASFNIYRNGILIANVPNSPPLKYIDRACKTKRSIYTITAVNTFGFESSPAPVVFTQR